MSTLPKLETQSMGRTYGGILGLLAFSLVLVRGWLKGGDAISNIEAACVGLVIMGVVGLIVGHLASWIVEDSVRSKFEGAQIMGREKSSDKENT